ncbi:hypothetical protein T484DRAFT_1608115, partial [Baffinella frigidus]
QSPKPETRNPKPEAQNPTPEALHPKPETRNLKPDTRNTKHKTRNTKHKTRTPHPPRCPTVRGGHSRILAGCESPPTKLRTATFGFANQKLWGFGLRVFRVSPPQYRPHPDANRATSF